jgi:hypothetical protein
MITLALILFVTPFVTPAASAEPEEEIRAVFGRLVAAQNAHDLGATRDLLWDSTRFLWITRGVPLWGREAALKRFEAVSGHVASRTEPGRVARHDAEQ